MEVEWIAQEIVLLIAAALLGGTVTWIFQSLLRKRGVFTYFVTHRKIGSSSADPIFGEISVTWNNNRVDHLYLSTIEMKNESMKDFENVVVTSFTRDTILLSESTNIVDTPNALFWSEDYKERLRIEPGQTPENHQIDLYNHSREHLIPVFNRGQAIRINYLNAATSVTMPSVWLSVTAKGVELKFRSPRSEFLGVPQGTAAFVGVILGILGLPILVGLISSSWILAAVAMGYGLVAQAPGAYLIKGFRAVKKFIGD